MSLAGRYDNPIPPRFLAPIDFKNSSSVYTLHFLPHLSTHFSTPPLTYFQYTRKILLFLYSTSGRAVVCVNVKACFPYVQHDPESVAECVPGGDDGNYIMFAR